jgi:PST family polysaccharide transporter/lipopolysaccharide exporter
VIDRLRTLLARLTPSGGVLQRTVASGVWSVVMNASDRGLQFLLTIVLAAMLGPRAFGLMGVALIVLSTVKRFSRLGLDEALVQNSSENVDRYLDTTFALQAGRGLLMAAVIAAAAPLAARLLGDPQATQVVRVVALSPLLVGLTNPGVIYFRKDLEFHKQFVWRVSGSVTRFLVGIGWALVSPTVWALIAGFVAADAARLLVSYVAHDYRPGLGFERDAAGELIDFGKWITGGSIVYFLYSEGDDLVVAWLLNSTALGFYRTAYQLANAPGTELSEVVRRVTFPAFSRIQDDLSTLRSGFFRSLRLVTAVAFPMAFGIAAVTPTFVKAFLGSDWVPMITTMRILAGYGLLLSVTATFGPIWKARGRPDIGTKLGALRVVILALAIVPVTNAFGIEGTAALVTGVYLFPMFPLDTVFLVRSLETTYARFARELVYPLTASVAMGAVVELARRGLTLGWLPLKFAVLVALGVVVYAGLALLLAIGTGWELEHNVREVAGVVRG